jgi:Recombinase
MAAASAGCCTAGPAAGSGSLFRRRGGRRVRARLLTVLGAQSQREVLRSRHRVLAAMQAQVVEQGRYLGGRPPYGYRLVDAGPHPNRAHARWGRRLQRLDPDPVCGPFVRWMFEQRLEGRSVAGIARELNERGIPCPSDVDPGRNRHREGGAWTLQTVAVTLAVSPAGCTPTWRSRRRAGRSAASSSATCSPASTACTPCCGERAGPHFLQEGENYFALDAVPSGPPTQVPGSSTGKGLFSANRPVAAATPARARPRCRT